MKRARGYDIDWDNLDFYFDNVNLEDGSSYDVEISNEELIKMLIKTAIDEENEEYVRA
ncbi:hypothetical protein AALP_AAs55560U000500 [Arabis alpina]|uniref:Uncharacterized protein n=1 Tax=Arabis alpina TaxID=50452 RepID=A0A087G3Q3_ARAAL|nr:hypothetical protein AALP_AAs55560U000500 [Arabis alpina]